MDSLIGRSQFLTSEAANLFTDEKTANARARIVVWCNQLVGAQPAQKCDILVKIQETILGACLELIDEFLESVLSLSHDMNSDVRKQVISFIENACKVKIELLPEMINVISVLLRDTVPQVIKRIIQACNSIYKNGLQWICKQTNKTDSAEQTWQLLSLMKAQILDMIDAENDGIRTNAIKFLEHVIILQSYADEDSLKRENDFSLANVPENLKLTKPQKLQEEANNIFNILLQFHAATHISSVNLIACTSSLANIAKMRPRYMEQVVEAYRKLVSNLPPTLTDSQVSSVRKTLKMQLQSMIKIRGAYEHQASMRCLLLELGATQNEVQKLIPKMEKQEHLRRQKRILENAATTMAKRLRMEQKKKHEMEIDEVELEHQSQKSTRVNEKFLAEYLRNTDVTVDLVIAFLAKLPDAVPSEFLEQYTPIKDLSIQQQILTISNILAIQMTAQHLGPGAAAFSKEPPMRFKQRKEIENDETDIDFEQSNTQVDTEQQRKEEATKKLRETIERTKGEQNVIERMKQRAKTLKLQEITKPLSKPMKEKFLLHGVKRILNAERQCLKGGVASKRRKLVTVIAATFPDSVRYTIFDFIMSDIKQRIDLAFSWLFEEYCLFQGFTRHTYVKTEHRPDYAYNELLNKLICGINQKCDYKDRIVLLRRIYLESPILSDDSIDSLLKLCYADEFMPHALEIIKDLIILRPPRRNRLVRILLGFTVHEHAELREYALGQLVLLYHVHKVLLQHIDKFAIEWLTHLEKVVPAASIFSEDYGRAAIEEAWTEDIVKICLIPILALLPYNPENFLKSLVKVFMHTSSEIKRTILRSLDVAIKKLGAANATLLRFIEDCPKGSETLIIRIIYLLTEKLPAPNAELVQRVREIYAHKVHDVRMLIPVLGGLTRQEILTVLPKFIKLNNAVVKEVFNRLFGIGAEFANQNISATPTDILVALHTIETSPSDLKFIVKATSMCLSERDIFTQEVLVVVLQQLVEIVPIPTLFMRTVIQSLTLYPKLTNFVLNLLQRLILKQVWRYKVIWDGFLKCVQRLKPQSLSILLQLPQQQLILALQQCPELRQPLLEYAESIQDEPMSGITQQILDIITGKSVDVFITDESGGYITLDNIKKEIDDVADITVIGTVPVLTSASILSVPASVPAPLPMSDLNQPLPPGED